jgi:putative PEP-CTERM system histidine kinase
LIFAETIRYGSWIFSELQCLRQTTGRKLNKSYLANIYGILLLTPLVSVLLLEQGNADSSLACYTWNSLILSVLSLSTTEQLYRNSKFSRLARILSLSLGCLFIFDIYFFSHTLIFGNIDEALWTSRGIVNALSGLLMVIGIITLSKQNNPSAGLSISRPIIFYTTTLTVAGVFMGLMATGGYYVQTYGGKWGTVLQTAFIFGTLLVLGTALISERVRARLNVWINKNFFHHKYDYRVEWLKLIDNLSRPLENQTAYEKAIVAMTTPFRCQGGALWIRQGNNYINAAASALDIRDNQTAIAVDSTFIQYISEQEWVLVSNEIIEDKLEISPPPWLAQIKDLWLIVPLINEYNLVGFMALSKPLDGDSIITWEDLDLLKTIGKQIANYIERHESAEELAQAKQFDAFNKLTAFIIHDLKNLIAQQALVVVNAEKHKENPAFFEDAIKTIDNSVTRMNTLLKKLQQNEPSEYRNVHLQKALIEAVKKCKDSAPKPALRMPEEPVYVSADPDRLIMTITHLIRNAQEATSPTGFVDVTLENHETSAIITVEDNGSGMSAEFIRNNLFKPFTTTKSGKGMGIGAFQVKEFVASLGGELTVKSTENLGSTFTITLPSSSKLI